MPETLEAAPVTSPDKPVVAPAGEHVQSNSQVPHESAGLRGAMRAIKSGEKNPEKIAAAAVAAEAPESPADVIANTPVVVDEPAKSGDDPLGETKETDKPAKEATETAKDEAEKAPKASRASLAAEARKSEEKAKETPADKPEVKLDGITEAEMKALPARDQKRIKHFIEKTNQAEARAKANEEKYAALEAEAKTLRENSGKLPDDIQSKLDKLTKLERFVDLQNDPEIKAKYDARIEASAKTAEDTIKGARLYGEFFEKVVKENGGLANLARSGREYSIQGPDGKPQKVAGSEIFNMVVDSLPGVDATVVRQALANQVIVAKEKDAAIAKESENAKEYFATTAKQTTERVTAWNKRVEETKSAAQVVFKEAAAKLDWLKDLEVPVDGPADKKSQAIEDKKFRAQLRAALADTMQNPAVIHAAAMAQTPEEQTDLRDLILDAHRVIDVDRKYAAAQARVTQLEAELAKVRSASSTTTKVGSAGAPAKATVASNGEPARLEGESDLRYHIRIAQEKRARPA